MDFRQDKGAFFAKLYFNKPCPDVVKKASMEDLDQTLPLHCYADPVNTLFPIHNPSDVIMSAGYFYGKGVQNPETEGAIKRAADLFGVSGEFNVARDLGMNYLALQKSAAEDVPGQAPVFLVSSPSHSFSGHGSDGLQKAASAFVDSYSRFAFDERVTLAAEFLSEAERLGCHLNPEVRKFAGHGTCDKEALVSEIRARAFWLNDLNARQSVLRKAEEVEKTAGAPTEDNKANWFNYLSKLDEEFRLQRGYDSSFTDPHRAVFNDAGSVKTASEDATSIRIHGHLFSQQKIASIVKNSIQGVFGEKGLNLFDGESLDVVKLASMDAESQLAFAQAFAD